MGDGEGEREDEGEGERPVGRGCGGGLQRGEEVKRKGAGFPNGLGASATLEH